MANPPASFTIERSTQVVQIYSENLGEGVQLNMVLIPPGEFLMGSPESESERFEDEGQHLVTISQPFFMGQTPVTQAQWERVAKMPKIQRKLEVNPSHFQGENLPVESVSWLDAEEFCLRLSAQTQRTYRLPSEAEWEYACRARTTTPFHFGETIDAELANYQAQDEKIGETTYPGKYGRGQLGEYRQKTTPVGMFPANAFGLYDMYGNVLEWCLDHWHNNYQGAPTDGSAWVDSRQKKDARRVLRGGSWLYNPRDCRSAYRNYFSADSRNDGIGFRVVYFSARILL